MRLFSRKHFSRKYPRLAGSIYLGLGVPLAWYSWHGLQQTPLELHPEHGTSFFVFLLTSAVISMLGGLLNVLFGDLPNHWLHYNPNCLSAKSIAVLSALGMIELLLLVLFSRR